MWTKSAIGYPKMIQNLQETEYKVAKRVTEKILNMW